MKKLSFFLSILCVFFLSGFIHSQDLKTNCVFIKVGEEKSYKGIIYYNIDRGGDPFLTEYYIFGLENGSGEFFQRKEYPMFNEKKIGEIIFKYSMPINGIGQAYFNLNCEKCR